MADKHGGSEKRRILERDEGEESDNKGERKKTGILLTAANVATNMVGSGVVAFPYAFKETGFMSGVLMVCVVGILSGYTLLVIVDAGQLCNKYSYQEIGKTAFGRPASVLVGFLQAVVSIMCAVTYNMFIADNVTKLLMRAMAIQYIEEIRSHFWGTRAFIIGVHTLIFAIPLVSAKSVANLSKLGVCTVISVAVSVVLFGVQLPMYRQSAIEGAYHFLSPDVAQGVGILAFGFMTHESSFIFYNSLSNPTKCRWRATVALATGVVGVIVIAMSVVGYVTFNESVQANLFENYCSTDDVITAARTLYVVALVTKFAVGLFAAREVIEYTLFSGCISHPFLRHVCIGVALCVLSYGVALSTHCLGVVMEFVAVFAISPLLFILPTLFLLRLQPSPIRSYRSCPPLAVLAFGICVSVVGLVNLCLRLAHGTTGCLLGEEPAYCLNSSLSKEMIK